MRLPRLLATSSISNRTSTAKINRPACNDDAFLVMSLSGMHQARQPFLYRMLVQYNFVV